ncbi:MAG: hypothetical protein ACRD4B_06455 [Acidobacteriota bacterium]
MPKTFYPPEGHDWVSSAELRKLEAHNEAELEASFDRRLADFRAAVFDKMQQHHAIHDGDGWAIFNIAEGSANTDSAIGLAETGQQRRVLIVTGFPVQGTGSSLSVPIIRIFSNECFVTDQGVELVSQDFTADGFGRTQYYTDVVNADDEVQKKFGSTLAVFFGTVGEELGFNDNFKSFTVGNGVAPAKHPEDVVMPFGHFSCMEDKIYALGQAEELLAEVADHEPAHFSHSARGES